MNSKIRKLFLACLILFILILFSYLRVFDILELPTFDFRYKLRPTQNWNKDIVIIEVSDDTLKELGSWPIPRDFHATLIRILKEYGVRQIIFDIVFSDPTNQDDDLALAIKESGNVYLPFVLSIDSKSKHILDAKKADLEIAEKIKDASKAQGFISTMPDIDGKYRWAPLFIKYGSNLFSHISLIAAVDYLKIDQRNIQFIPDRFIKIGSFTKIPLDNKARCLINYPGKWHKVFKHYSYYDILVSYKQALFGETPRINLDDLNGKVCFIGLTATATCDLNPIPIENTYPMVGSNASIFNMIVQGSPIMRASHFVNIILLLFFSLLTIFVNRKFKFLDGSILTIFIIVILFILSCVSFYYFGIWIDLFYPILILFIIYLSINLFKYLNEKRKNELVEKELIVAKKIQESFLPKGFPRSECFEIAGLMVPARKIGGDLYDFVQLGNQNIGVMIADVSGKGVPAALFMAKTISDFRYFAKSNDLPKDVLLKLNNKLSIESRESIFVTMNYLVLDIANKKIIAANAGHFSPIVIRAGKSIELNFDFGPPLGILEEAQFSQVEFPLEKDDIIVLYTDGVIEAKSIKTEDFGKQKLINDVIESKHLKASELVSRINDGIAKFSYGATQHDDLTIIVIKCI
ncbi:MAG: SpoIIE family protein phosphatase [Candidatus Omnitrophota bacterium]